MKRKTANNVKNMTVNVLVLVRPKTARLVFCGYACSFSNLEDVFLQNKVGVPKLRITHCADCLSGNIYEVIPCKYPGCRTGRHPEHHECDKKLEDEKREAERRKAEEESYELGADVDDDGSVSD